MRCRMPEAPVDAVWVLSDLHLAPRTPRLEFRSAAELTALLRTIAQQVSPQALVLNGDVFDYLQLPGYAELSLPLAAERTHALLAGVAAPDERDDVLGGLRAVAAAGHRILVVPGNHDPELALAEVQRVLREWIDPAGKAQIAFHVGAAPWEIGVGGRRVLGTHGHLGDPCNSISVDAVLAAQHRGDATCALPPGSTFVCDVINPFRRASHANGERRFPFVDLIKPDLAAALLVLYVDPPLALERSRRALLPGIRTLVRAVQGRLHRAPRLAEPDGDPSGATHIDTLAAAIVDALTPGERAAASVVEQALQDLDWRLGADAPGSLGPKDFSRSIVLRAFGRAMESARGEFSFKRRDSLARAAFQAMPDDDGCVFVTGHTHAAKRLRLGRDRHYLNTGTWQDLIVPPPRVPDRNWQDWVDALLAGDVPRVRRLTYARITADTVELATWR